MLAVAMPMPTERIRHLPSGKDMGAEMKRIREDVLKLKQQDVADMLGTTTRTIQRWENHGEGGVALVAAFELMRCWEAENKRTRR